LALEIFGHEDVKKVLLLLLVGAPHRKLKDGMKVNKSNIFFMDINGDYWIEFCMPFWGF
jgi:DNA replicative helicase MCM subunit Mcm2 (Cdc46/Mcm family)